MVIPSSTPQSEGPLASGLTAEQAKQTFKTAFEQAASSGGRKYIFLTPDGFKAMSRFEAAKTFLKTLGNVHMVTPEMLRKFTADLKDKGAFVTNKISTQAEIVGISGLYSSKKGQEVFDKVLGKMMVQVEENTKIREQNIADVINNNVDLLPEVAEFLLIEVRLMGGDGSQNEAALPETFQSGEPINTVIAENDLGGPDASKKVQVQASKDNAKAIRAGGVSQIPNVVIDGSRKVGSPGAYFEHNNYPKGSGGGAHTNCDHGMVLQETFGGKFAAFALADGNGFGVPARNAAVCANKIGQAVLKYELGKLANQPQFTHQDIIRAHDNAFFAAQKYLERHSEDLTEETKTKTTCQQHMTVSGDTAHISTIGDVKAFIISSDLSSVREPTLGGRGGFEGDDCGGRIGFDNERDELDLRNYSHSITKLFEGDVVIMCSDGVHDNLDPGNLGLSPNDVDPKLTGDWDDKNPEHVEARNKFIGQKLLDVLKDYKVAHNLGNLTQQDIDTAINEYVQKTTENTRKFMEEPANKHKKLPSDYKEYPGKVDHANLIVYQH